MSRAEQAGRTEPTRDNKIVQEFRVQNTVRGGDIFRRDDDDRGGRRSRVRQKLVRTNKGR